MSGRRRRVLGVISAGLAAVALAAGAVVGGAAVTASPAAAASRGQAGRLTARLVLARAAVPSGSVLRGSLVLENPSSTARVLLHGCRVDGLFGVGFRAADGYLSAPAFSLVGCDEDLPGNELIARPGRTVDRFDITAR